MSGTADRKPNEITNGFTNRFAYFSAYRKPDEITNGFTNRYAYFSAYRKPDELTNGFTNRFAYFSAYRKPDKITYTITNGVPHEYTYLILFTMFGCMYIDAYMGTYRKPNGTTDQRWRYA
jgi:hypothetical protein